MKHGLIEVGPVHQSHNFEMVNIQPGRTDEYPKLKVCPYFAKLLEAAILLGNEEAYVKTYHEFCGLSVTINHSSAHGLGDSGTTQTLCLHMYYALGEAINSAGHFLSPLSKEDAENPSPDMIEGLKYLEAWARLVPMMGGKKPRTRSPKEILLYVKRLRSWIEKNATGKRFSTIGIHQLKPGCKQMPESSGPIKRYAQE